MLVISILRITKAGKLLYVISHHDVIFVESCSGILLRKDDSKGYFKETI